MNMARLYENCSACKTSTAVHFLPEVYTTNSKVTLPKLIYILTQVFAETETTISHRAGVHKTQVKGFKKDLFALLDCVYVQSV